MGDLGPSELAPSTSWKTSDFALFHPRPQGRLHPFQVHLLRERLRLSKNVVILCRCCNLALVTDFRMSAPPPTPSRRSRRSSGDTRTTPPCLWRACSAQSPWCTDCAVKVLQQLSLNSHLFFVITMQLLPRTLVVLSKRVELNFSQC